MKKHQTSFERFEYKFWMPGALADEALRFSAPYLRCDDWAPGGQRNTSLYLDSPRLTFADLHRQGAPDRSKLRVRAYGNPPVGPAFVEIKRKVKQVTLKQRAAIPIEHVEALVRDGVMPKVQSAEEQRTLEGFLYLMLVHQARPTVLVTCRREAYASVNPDEGVRLTVDRDVWYQPAPGPHLRGDPRRWVPLCGQRGYQSGSFALIELKFRAVAPWWTTQLAQALQLVPTAFSKYITAIDALEQGDGDADLFDARAQHGPLLSMPVDGGSYGGGR